MTALERIRRRRRAMASFLMPLLAVVSIDASGACVGMAADGATAGFANAIAASAGDARHGVDHPSHDLTLGHGAASSHERGDSQALGRSHGHVASRGPAHSDGRDAVPRLADSRGRDAAPGPGHSHGHDDAQRSAESHEADRSHQPRSVADVAALYAGAHHGHGDCPHCPSSPTGEDDSGHAICSVAEGTVAASAFATSVQWDQKPFLSPIAWIAPPAAAPPTRILDVSSPSSSVPEAHSLHVRFCVLLL